MPNFRWIDKRLHKLSSGQECPALHVTSLIGENVIAAYSENISQGYCIHLPNMKRIRFMAVKLLRKENADPANPADLEESLLPYTNKHPSLDT